VQIDEGEAIKSKGGNMTMFTDRHYVFCSLFQKSFFFSDYAMHPSGVDEHTKQLNRVKMNELHAIKKGYTT